jgi:hypothetical protein
MVLFFKIRSTAISLKEESNCTSRAKANITTHKQRTRITHTTRHSTTTTREKSQEKPPQTAPLSPMLCHATSHNPLQAPAATSELLHLELSPTSPSHMTIDPSAPTLLRHDTRIVVLMKTTGPDHSTLRPRLTHRLTLLC